MGLTIKQIEEEVKKELKDLPESIVSKTIECLKKYQKQLTKEKLKNILNDIKEFYNKCLVEEYYPVGVVASQSFSEPLTQLTMRTFHYAGLKEFKVTLAIDRIKEILEARKTLKAPSMIIYLKDKYSKSFEDASKCALKIIETQVKHITKSIEVDIFDRKLVFYLDKDEMKRREITISDVVSKISAKKKFIEKVNVDNKNYKITIETKTNTITELYDLLQDIRRTRVKGIKDIKKVMIRQDEQTGEWYIQTEGSNLKAVLKLDFVDPTRTITNNIFEIYEVLGIEAAREMIVRELYDLLVVKQGLDVDIRHIMLIADTITWSGRIKSIGRKGIVRDKTALVRMSFEETPRQIADVAYTGEEDPGTSVVASVILGKPIEMGTGAVKLQMDYEKFLEVYKKLKGGKK